MTSIFLNVLSYVLRPWYRLSCRMPCVCHATVEGRVLQMSATSSWSIVMFKSPVFLMIFCLVVLSIIENGILKSYFSFPFSQILPHMFLGLHY